MAGIIDQQIIVAAQGLAQLIEGIDDLLASRINELLNLKAVQPFEHVGDAQRIVDSRLQLGQILVIINGHLE